MVLIPGDTWAIVFQEEWFQVPPLVIFVYIWLSISCTKGLSTEMILYKTLDKCYCIYDVQFQFCLFFCRKTYRQRICIDTKKLYNAILCLIHLDLVTPSKILRHIGLCSGMSSVRCQTIIWTNADLLPSRPQVAYFNEILFEIQKHFSEKMHLKWRLQNVGLFVQASTWLCYAFRHRIFSIGTEWRIYMRR